MTAGTDRSATGIAGPARPRRRRPPVRMILVAVTALLGVQIALPAALLLLRHRLLFFPDRLPAAAGLAGGPAAGDVSVAVVSVRRPDGRTLEAYDVRPAEGAPDVAILFLHGNAGCIAHRAATAVDLARRLRRRVLLPGYSGYGANEGRPTEEEVVRDAEAAFDHLAAADGPRPRVVVWGESLGGAVAVALATRRPVDGVVAQSTFLSVASMARRLYPWLPLTAFLARDVFPTDRIAPPLGPRLLVLHGDRDGIVPIEEGRALHDAVPGSTFVAVRGAGHDDLRDAADEATWDAVRAHVAACVARAPGDVRATPTESPPPPRR